jgi:hypothetical protein
MGFGRVTKYWRISLKDINHTPLLSGIVRADAPHEDHESVTMDGDHIKNGEDTSLVQSWDEAVEHASGKYRYEDHNLITNNCHAHVATSLNRLHFRDITYWNTVLIMLYLVIYGKYVRYGTVIFFF